jgi:SAGA-associated factor 73
MTSGASSVISLPHNFGPDAIIKGLKKNLQDNQSAQSTTTSDSIVWKDLGQYLETLTEVKYEESNFKNQLHTETPLNTTIDYKVCTLCNRPILVHHLGKHIKQCLALREKREREVAENIIMVEDSKKKRKLDKESTPLDDPKSKAKKPKKEGSAVPAKPKKKANAKNKGPVDVEKQCGVALPGGGFCARSLTCKTHSMGAKRAVPGRSASYDVLLAAYQHKNQVKIAGQAAKLQAEKDEILHGGSATLDSDEETHQVLAGVQRSFPLPLERKNLVSTRVRANFLRMREMFAGAILPRITNSNGMGGFNGRTALLDVDKSNDYLFVVRAPQRIMMGNKAQPIQGQSQPQPQPQSNGSITGASAPGSVPAGQNIQPIGSGHTPTPASSLAQQQAANRNTMLAQQQALAARQKALMQQQMQPHK